MPKKPNPPRQVLSPRWQELDAVLREAIAARKPKPALVQRAESCAALLKREFPEAKCALHYGNAFELIVATILSAQCTDERVNKVTPALFKKYRSPRAFADSPPGELETDIHSTGFFNNKAKAIRAMAAEIDSHWKGAVPRAMDDLLTLRGVARKTANVVRANAFGLPGLTVDTHFMRITGRLGLTKSTDPEKIEFEIATLLMPEEYSHFSHSVILHGRKTCSARKPACERCVLRELCPSAGKD